MVFKGLPSQGCEHCRKVKKRCGLERPACLRCVRQKLVCVGYPEVTTLIFRDQNQSVRAKVERQQVKKPNSNRKDVQRELPTERTPQAVPRRSRKLSVAALGATDGCVWSDILQSARHTPSPSAGSRADDLSDISATSPPIEIKIHAEEVALSYFIQQFTSDTHWYFLRDYVPKQHLHPCLHSALQACGMAALANVHKTSAGTHWAQRRYTDAVGLLNQALRDPDLACSDDNLLVVRLLAYYENIACERPQSIKSWQAHLDGATQMLKLRGRRQFESAVGRVLFRELRRQIILCCIWNDCTPPCFLVEFQLDLDSRSSHDEYSRWRPFDQLNLLSFDLARLRSDLRERTLADVAAAEECSRLEQRLLDWQQQVINHKPSWTWREVEVCESEEVWNGRLFVFSENLAPEVWNKWRCLRVMLSRTQEMLCRRLDMPELARQQQVQGFRQIRRQMADDICATIPACLGFPMQSRWNAALVLAYACVWPLFFAATCAFERAGTGAVSLLQGTESCAGAAPSAACAQVVWVLGRLTCIAEKAGLKWARGVTAPLRGQFQLQEAALRKPSVMHSLRIFCQIR